MNSYASTSQVSSDLALYLTRQAGQSPTLDLIQQIAAARWGWLCDNWEPTFKARLEAFTGGDEELEALLVRLGKDVQTYKLGAKAFNPFNSILRFTEYGPLLQSIAMADLGLSIDEQIVVNKELQRVADFTIDTFLAMRGIVRSDAATACQVIGLGDEDAARVEGVSFSAAQRSPLIADYDQIATAYDLENILDQIIFDLRRTTVAKDPDLLSVANSNLAVGSSTAVITSYKTYVSVPFYQSLEEMARRYLGSTDLWFELATVNNLQPPYVDEVGTKYPLTAPGAGSAVRISNEALFGARVGTRVKVGSVTKQAIERYVDRVVENTDGTITLVLSGEPTLGSLKTSDSAYVRVYAPSTVNSDSLLKVPFDVASAFGTSPDARSDVIQRLDSALRAFGVDISRNERTGDVVVSGGDFALGYGIANVRQAVLNVLRTNPGELPFHPRYGMPVTVGDAFGGSLDEGAIIAEVIQKSIEADGRYQSVIIRDIQVTPNSASISMLVVIPGFESAIPLSFVAGA